MYCLRPLDQSSVTKTSLLFCVATESQPKPGDGVGIFRARLLSPAGTDKQRLIAGGTRTFGFLVQFLALSG